jgi:hypothetical protein
VKKQINISRPEPDEYPVWFSAEIELVPYDDLMTGLNASLKESLIFLNHFSEQQLLYRYLPGKWTIKEMWQHVIDVERVLSYRALRYARQDPTVLQGFDEKKYAENSRANQRPWKDLLHEFKILRQCTLLMFNSFGPDTAMLRGTTGKSNMSVRALGFLILGHEIHHIKVIKERYLI